MARGGRRNRPRGRRGGSCRSPPTSGRRGRTCDKGTSRPHGWGSGWSSGGGRRGCGPGNGRRLVARHHGYDWIVHVQEVNVGLLSTYLVGAVEDPVEAGVKEMRAIADELGDVAVAVQQLGHEVLLGQLLPRVPRPGIASRDQVGPLRDRGEAACIEFRHADCPAGKGIQMRRGDGDGGSIEEVVVPVGIGVDDEDVVGPVRCVRQANFLCPRILVFRSGQLLRRAIDHSWCASCVCLLDFPIDSHRYRYVSSMEPLGRRYVAPRGISRLAMTSIPVPNASASTTCSIFTGASIWTERIASSSSEILGLGKGSLV